MARMGAKCPECGEITGLPLNVAEGGTIVGIRFQATCENCGKGIEVDPDDLIPLED